MVDFQSVASFFLSDVTRLAYIPVALTGGTPLSHPIFAVIRFISTLPAWVIFSDKVFRLPFPHTFPITKITGVYHCVFAFHILSAPIAINDDTPPTKQNGLAFKTTGRGFGFVELVEAIGFYVKLFFTNGANCFVGLLCLVLSRTYAIAKPKPRFVVFYAASFSFYITSAIGTLNNNMVFSHV